MSNFGNSLALQKEGKKQGGRQKVESTLQFSCMINNSLVSVKTIFRLSSSLENNPRSYFPDAGIHCSMFLISPNKTSVVMHLKHQLVHK